MGLRSGMGLRSPERVGKTSETSENVGGGLNEIWYMRWSGMGLRSPERVGKTSETSENVGGGLNEIWYMTLAVNFIIIFLAAFFQYHLHSQHDDTIQLDAYDYYTLTAEAGTSSSILQFFLLVLSKF